MTNLKKPCLVPDNSQTSCPQSMQTARFAPSVFGRAIEKIQNLVRPNVFSSRPTPIRNFIAQQFERQRIPADSNLNNLKEAIFSRPSQEIEYYLSGLLRRPIQEVRGILAKNRLYNQQIEQKRTRVSPPELIRAYCKSFNLLQGKEYLELIGLDSRSRILASFHFGDFIYGSNSLLALDNPSRTKLVLSQDAGSDAYFENLFSGFGKSVLGRSSELLYAETTSLELSRRLRNEATTLLLFCDMPPAFNETVVVNFLKRPARFSVGPAVLAIANNVPLLPIISFYDGKANRVRCSPQIEPTLYPGETIRSGAERITQRVISFFEATLECYPEQWRFTGLLPIYFLEESSQIDSS